MPDNFSNSIWDRKRPDKNRPDKINQGCFSSCQKWILDKNVFKSTILQM